MAALAAGLPQQLQSVAAAQPEVEQTHVVTISAKRLQTSVISWRPFHKKFICVDFVKKVACEVEVVFVVLDQQHFSLLNFHNAIQQHQFGNSTNSTQYCPSVFINSTNRSKVTGFVMNELAPMS